MKVLINADYGGFSVSRKFVEKLRELDSPIGLWITLSGERYWEKDDDGVYQRTGEINDSSMDECYYLDTINCYDGREFTTEQIRSDPLVIQAFEELNVDGSSMGRLSRLKIVEIPDDIEWYIDDYDGWETVREKHRSWS